MGYIIVNLLLCSNRVKNPTLNACLDKAFNSDTNIRQNKLFPLLVFYSELTELCSSLVLPQTTQVSSLHGKCWMKHFFLPM